MNDKALERFERFEEQYKAERTRALNAEYAEAEGRRLADREMAERELQAKGELRCACGHPMTLAELALRDLEEFRAPDGYAAALARMKEHRQ